MNPNLESPLHSTGASQLLVQRLYNQMTPEQREQVASWELANQDELEAQRKNMQRASWTEELAKYDRETAILRKIDNALLAVSIMLLLTSPAWAGPLWKLLSGKGGVL